MPAYYDFPDEYPVQFRTANPAAPVFAAVHHRTEVIVCRRTILALICKSGM